MRETVFINGEDTDIYVIGKKHESGFSLEVHGHKEAEEMGEDFTEEMFNHWMEYKDDLLFELSENADEVFGGYKKIAIKFLTD